MSQAAGRVHVNQLHATLRQYGAELHRDVSTDKGMVFFSKSMQQWILVRRKGDQAILTFSSDCPCKDMGKKY